MNIPGLSGISSVSDSSTPVDHSTGTFLGNLLLYIYFFLIIAKKISPFDDGLVDVVLLGMITGYLAMRPGALFDAIRRMLKLSTVRLIALFTCYFVFLAVFFHSVPKLTIIEYLSTFKWIVYLILGLMLGFSSPPKDINLIGNKHVFVVASIIFIYSVATYNWLGLFKYGLSFRSFYDNSFESIFTLRSVFALFGLVLLFYCINNRPGILNSFMTLYSLVFLYMAGNRKMLIALIVLVFAANLSRKHRLLLKISKVTAVLIFCFYLPSTDLYKKSAIEYTNLDQPRLFAYLKAFEIASDYFPIGSGPSTFASRGSMVDYSPVYQWYGLSDKYGFRPDDEEHFYNDTYWCQIIGQYGVAGTLFVVCILAFMYRDFKSLGKTQLIRLRYEHILLLLILLSTVTPLFQRTEIALFIFFILGHKVASCNIKSCQHSLSTQS